MTGDLDVSGILIFYQAERFIEEAIESVLMQTLPTWELLLVDDGSTDGSTSVARKYASKYPDRVRYLQHENHAHKGKSTSRNLGLHHARAKYIAFLDADDVWLPSKLAEQVAMLDRHPEAVMVYGPTLCWYSWDERNLRRSDLTTSVGVKPDRVHHGTELLTRFVKRGGMVPGICSLLVRRDVVASVDGFDQSIQDMFEDQTLLAKLCLAGPVFVSSGCFDRYRQHDASSSAQAVKIGVYHPWKPNPARLKYLSWLQRYASQHPSATANLRSAVERDLWCERHARWGTFARTPQMLMEVAAQKLSRSLRFR